MILLDFVVDVLVYIAIGIQLLSLLFVMNRVARGRNTVERLIAFDLISGICFCLVVLLGILTNNTMSLLVALGIILVSFIATLAFAHFITHDVKRAGRDYV